MLVLALATFLAWAAPTLGDVRVFSGAQHARILLTLMLELGPSGMPTPMFSGAMTPPTGLS